MFDNLQDKMDRVFKTLRGEGSLNEWHIDNALKEIRVALLEADVHFKVVKDFTTRVREKAVGSEVLTAFSPAQQVTKIRNGSPWRSSGMNGSGGAICHAGKPPNSSGASAMKPRNHSITLRAWSTSNSIGPP